MKPTLVGFLAAGAIALVARMASAAPCAGPLDALAVVRCVLEQDPQVQRARQELHALDGRRITAGTHLPANPVVSFSAAARRAPLSAGGGVFFNGYFNLSQEVEVAGQRGGRIALATAELAAERRRLIVAEQAAAAVALTAYFDQLASTEAMALARDLDRTAQTLATLAEERLREQLISQVDADLVQAERIRIGLIRLDVERDVAAAKIHLATWLGQTPGTPIELHGDLDPHRLVPGHDGLPEPEALIEHALALRSEVAAAAIEQEIARHRVVLLNRERVPNPSFSLYVQRDGLAEQVYGAGFAFPIPLPWPAGRVRTGEIVEARARVAQAETQHEQVERRVRQEVALAVSHERSHAAALAFFPAPVLERVRSELLHLGEQLATGRLSARDSILAQRSLIDVLRAHLQARLAYAHAWVELRRAAGLPLPGVSP